jgi:hypothetical protein
MRLSRFSLVFCAAFTLLVGEAAAQEEGVPGTECCLPLLIPIGARPIALGQALTARGGRDGIFFNPAGLMTMRDDEFFVHRSTTAEDKITTFGLIIHSAVAGVFGITYRLIDFGEIETTDENGNVVGRLAFLDQTLIATFATRIKPGWNAGLSYKLYDFRDQCEGVCGERFQGSTHLIDAGTEIRPSRLPHLVVGAAITHAGLALQIKNRAQADPSPLRLRLGAAYEVGHHLQRDTTVEAWVHADVVQRVRDASAPAVNFGVEVVLNKTFSLRAGHSTEGDGTNGATFSGTGIGIGLLYQRFDISVAKTLSTTELGTSDPMHISFGVSF